MCWNVVGRFVVATVAVVTAKELPAARDTAKEAAVTAEGVGIPKGGVSLPIPVAPMP